MLVDWFVFGLLVVGSTKLLNATAFKHAPASSLAAWTLTIISFIVGVFALSALKLLSYHAISDSVGLPVSPKNPLDIGAAFAFSWMFFSLLNRREKRNRLAAAKTSQAPSVVGHSQPSSVPPTTGRSSEKVRVLIIMIVAVCVVLPLIGIALKADNQKATEVALHVPATQQAAPSAQAVGTTPLAAALAPEPAPTPPPLAQATAQNPQLDSSFVTDANAIQAAFSPFTEIAKPYGAWTDFTKHSDFQQFAADPEFIVLWSEAFERRGDVIVGAKPAIAKAAARRLAELMGANKPSSTAAAVASGAESLASTPARDAEATTASVAPIKAPATAMAANAQVLDRAFYSNPLPTITREDYSDPFAYFQRKQAQEDAATGSQIAAINKQNEEFRRSYQERYQYHLHKAEDEQARQGRFVAAYLPSARAEWSAIVGSRLWLVDTSEMKRNKYDDFFRNRLPLIAPSDASPADVSALRSEFAKVFPPPK